MTSGSSGLEAARREGLTVIGEGRINTVPDEILLVISGDCTANNAGQALAESNTKLVQVVHATMGQGAKFRLARFCLGAFVHPIE